MQRGHWGGFIAWLVIAVIGCGDNVTPDPDVPPEDEPFVCTSSVTPTPVASVQHYPGGLALDDDHVYWADYVTSYETGRGGIHRVSKSGGAVTSVYSSADLSSFEMRQLTYHAGALFWVEEYRDRATSSRVLRLRTMPAAGGVASDVMSVDGLRVSWHGFIVDDDATYVSGLEDLWNILERVPHGGSPERLATLPQYLSGLVVDATDLYATSTFDGIWRMPKSGGGGGFITPREHGGPELLLDESYLYRHDYSDKKITVFTKTGNLVRSIDTSLDQLSWSSILLAGDDLYLKGPDAIFGVSRFGGGLMPVMCPADGVESVRYLAADATKLFFIGSYLGGGSHVLAIDRR